MLDMIFSAKINETSDTAGSTRMHLAGAIDNVFCRTFVRCNARCGVLRQRSRRRYVVVNQTLVNRCGLKEKYELVGRTVSEVFPASLAATFEQQDQLVLNGGQDVRDQLELHLYPDRDPGWCLTNKIALRDAQQRIIGLTGTSRDLGMPDQRHPVYHRIAAAVRSHPFALCRECAYGRIGKRLLVCRWRRLNVTSKDLLIDPIDSL